MIINMREMKIDQKATIKEIKGRGDLIRRIRDMGIVPGAQIKVVGKAPLYDPVAIKVKGQKLTLRNNEADHIIVEVE